MSLALGGVEVMLLMPGVCTERMRSCLLLTSPGNEEIGQKRFFTFFSNLMSQRKSATNRLPGGFELLS